MVLRHGLYEVNGNTPIAICFSGAGGIGTEFDLWNSSTPGDLQFIGVELPGRGHRIKEKAHEQVFPLIETIAPEILSLIDNRAFVVFGHSFGGLVAFEFCRWLKKNSYTLPGHLYIAGRAAPNASSNIKKTHDLSREKLVEMLGEYGGASSDIINNERVMNFFLPAIRADLKANFYYHYIENEPFDFPITVLHGQGDKVCSLREVEAWRKETKGKFSTCLYEGGHFFYRNHRKAIVDLIGKNSNAFIRGGC